MKNIHNIHSTGIFTTYVLRKDKYPRKIKMKMKMVLVIAVLIATLVKHNMKIIKQEVDRILQLWVLMVAIQIVHILIKF